MRKVNVIGHIGNDATLNTVNGKQVINFNVAVSEKWKDQQGNAKEQTTWFSCSWWSERTAIQPYLKKGTQVFVEGKIGSKIYNDQQQRPTSQLTIEVSMVQLLGNANNNSQQQSQPTPASSEMGGTGMVDDLPF